MSKKRGRDFKAFPLFYGCMWQTVYMPMAGNDKSCDT